MTRTRSSAKQAGARHNRLTVNYLRDELEDDRIEVAPSWGANDKGDVVGVRIHGRPVAVQCKDYGGRVLVGPWLDQVETQRGNADAIAGVVVAKRRGYTNYGDQIVMMTLRDLAALIGGPRASS